MSTQGDKEKIVLAALIGAFDDQNGLPSRDEITAKALRLAAWSGGASEMEMRQAVDALWQVADWPRVGMLLKGTA